MPQHPDDELTRLSAPGHEAELVDLLERDATELAPVAATAARRAAAEGGTARTRAAGDDEPPD